jgi:hypothetical protein
MKKKIGLPLVLLPVLFVGGSALAAPTQARALSATERAALTAAAKPELATQRAGAATRSAVMAGDERAQLQRAQQQAKPELAAQRGGDLHLTDHELKIIAVVLLVVLVIAAL